jgi:hypothetical protein
MLKKCVQKSLNINNPHFILLYTLKEPSIGGGFSQLLSIDILIIFRLKAL